MDMRVSYRQVPVGNKLFVDDGSFDYCFVWLQITDVLTFLHADDQFVSS